MPLLIILNKQMLEITNALIFEISLHVLSMKIENGLVSKDELC